jgi:hypothetical protein
LVCDEVLLQIKISKLYNVFKIGLSLIKNEEAASNNVDILDLKFSTSFTNQTYEQQLQPIRWITSIIEENDSSSKTKKSLYITLICSLVITPAVALLLYYRRRILPKYWNSCRKALF